MVNFCSNDYLGLSKHPLLIARAQEFSRRYGTGATASRLICGTYRCMEEVEEKTGPPERDRGGPDSQFGISGQSVSAGRPGGSACINTFGCIEHIEALLRAPGWRGAR